MWVPSGSFEEQHTLGTQYRSSPSCKTQLFESPLWLSREFPCRPSSEVQHSQQASTRKQRGMIQQHIASKRLNKSADMDNRERAFSLHTKLANVLASGAVLYPPALRDRTGNKGGTLSSRM